MVHTASTARRGRGIRIMGLLGVTLVAAVLAAVAFANFGSASAHSSPDAVLAAKVAFADGKHELAEKLARAHIKRHPDDASAGVLLGRILLARGRAIDACELFTGLTRKDPTNAAALRGLAESHDALRQRELAVVAWQRLTHAAPDDPTAWRGLSLALHARGDGMAALSAIQRALALDPGQSDLSQLMTEIATGQAFAAGGPHESFDGMYPRPNTRPPIGPERPDPLKSVGGRR